MLDMADDLTQGHFLAPCQLSVCLEGLLSNDVGGGNTPHSPREEATTGLRQDLKNVGLVDQVQLPWSVFVHKVLLACSQVH